MLNIKGVIFDLDGVILDSMWMWGDIAQMYLRSLGASPRPDIIKTLRNLNTVEEAQYYIDEYGIDLPLEEVIAGRNNMILGFFSNEVKLKPGVLSVLEALKSRNIKICVATATERYLVEPALKLHGIIDYFERIFTCEEEETSKSSPDIFLRAAKFLDTDIHETLVVEDSLYAMETALNAGFVVAGVYDMISDDNQEKIKAISNYYWKTLDEMHALL